MANIESRRTEDGSASYRVKVRLKGHSTATATFTRLTDAKRWAQSTEAAMREGRHFKTAEAKRHTFAELVDRYVREVLPHKPKSAAGTALQLLWWKSKLGHLVLADVTAARISQCRNELLGTKTRRNAAMSPATVVRYMAALSHALNTAIKDWEWMEDSPMGRVSKPQEPRGRERFLSDAERDALLAACKASSSRFLYTVVVLGIKHLGCAFRAGAPDSPAAGRTRYNMLVLLAHRKYSSQQLHITLYSVGVRSNEWRDGRHSASSVLPAKR